MEGIKFVSFVLLIIGYVIAKPQYNRPVIKNVSKQEIAVDAKHSLTLFCEGNEKITWTYPNNTIDGNYWSRMDVQTSEVNGKHFAKLTLQNASFVDVDYYYCHAENAAKDDPLRSTKVYVYVRDDEHFSALPEEEIVFLTATQNSNVTLPCRPTSPDVTVKLFDINGEEVAGTTKYHSHVGYEVKMSTFDAHYLCKFTRDGHEEELTVIVTIITNTDFVPKPYIEAPESGRTTVGNTYVLNCTVTVEQNVYFTLNWTTPNPAAVESKRISMTTASAINVNSVRQGSSSLTIKDVQFSDAGLYTCIITDHTHKTNNVSKEISVFDGNGSYINLQEESGMSTINTSAGINSVQWVFLIDSYPKADIQCLNNKGEEIFFTKSKTNKYSLEFGTGSNRATLKINQLTLNDSGVYQIIANNGKTIKKLNFTLIVQDRPTVHIISPNYHLLYENTSLDCRAAGNPIPTVEWFFKPCEDNSCRFEKLSKSMYTSTTEGLLRISTLKMNATVTGLIQCLGSNVLDNDTSTQGFYVTDVEEGFDIWGLDKSNQVAAGSKMKLTCAVSKYNFTNHVRWFLQKGQERKLITSDKKFQIEKHTTKYTYRTTLIINPIAKTDRGTYLCMATPLDFGSDVSQQQYIDVRDPMKPNIFSSNMNGTTIRMKPGYLGVTLYCNASGIPYPDISWRKDNKDWAKGVNYNHVKLSGNELVFNNVDDEDAGTYSCRATNYEGSDERTMKLEIIGAKSWAVIYIVIIILLALFFLVLVTFLVVKIKREKKLRRELRIAGLMNFEKGGPESLNPDLAVDEQAELLPYDKKWEFPRDKLKLGKQLGSGAFGVVMKAEAFGLVEGETITTVAVKMVKRNADYTYIKALASELKIMVHLGKHLNVVNLLGACTKNVTKRELLVIVEYCRFGNLHNYLLRHRDDFVNQIDTKTGHIDTTIGAEFLSRTMSVGSNQSGGRTMAFAGVDYRAAPNLSSTTDSTVVCSPTGEDTMILSNNSSIQPEWRSNYRGDYKGNVRPTSTHDLLCWAFQVARGMEYLVSRRVLHGDLAARNILLAEDNIVKICDFGLAKSMYKSDNYKKKGDGPLPVKWMAVESIRDRVFSTQSDVWSFGIVLWEFFSLARTPYPGMDADERLYNKLVDGYRMDQPEYSTKEIYQIMLECWHAKPVYRPSFTKLADDLGNMLQDAVRKHYIDLNDPYIMMNNEQQEGHSDYLAMLSPPDYGNLASPGPDYVNGKTFPEEEPAEASGYLPMDIFSPRSNESPSPVFDFEVHKNKNVNGEPATGVELLPILHSNESDNDMSPTSPMSKSFANPNYQTNPSVDNKEISAPKKDNIVPTSDNYINMPQQKSVLKSNTDSFSNPSYIHMNNKTVEENEKSNYVNSHSRDWERPIV